jgi:hypothetical protein
MKITLQESETIEFKSSFNEATIETLVAFANTQGGTVFIGVITNIYFCILKKSEYFCYSNFIISC